MASASLAQVLLLDPEILLEPIEPPFVEVTLIPGDQSIATLFPLPSTTGRKSRPNASCSPPPNSVYARKKSVRFFQPW